jgi:hypothetical protein
MRMSEERPVELHAFAAWALTSQRRKEMFWSVKLDSTPISIAQVVNTIANVSFTRAINFATCRCVAGDIQDYDSFSWAQERHKDGRKEGIRARFNLEPQDIIVERGYLDDAALMGSDPVAWVHKQLEKQRTLDAA